MWHAGAFPWDGDMTPEPRKEVLLAATRRRIPRAIQACAAVCVVLFVGYGLLYLTLRATDPDLARAMLRLFGLTIVAGRETALFDAERNGMPLGMAIGLSIVDDLATLLLNITLVWFLVATLQRASHARRILARIETQALRRRHWVHRWGLLGLAVFYLVPGFGSGPAVAAALGVLARIPIARLALVLGCGVALVDLLWAVGVSFPARATADLAWLDWLPAIVVAVLGALSLVGLWRDRRHRGHVLLDWQPDCTPGHRDALATWGITLVDGLVDADLPRVAAATGLPRKLALYAAELLVLEGLQPAQAAALVRAGVRGLRDAAGWTGAALAQGAGAGVQAQQGAAWHAQATALVAASGSAWRRAA